MAELKLLLHGQKDTQVENHFVFYFNVCLLGSSYVQSSFLGKDDKVGFLTVVSIS